MELASTASVLGLHGYSHIAPEVFKTFHDLILDIFASQAITPTYFGAQGEGYAEDYAKITGRSYKRLIASKFDRIHELSIVANPSTSDAPAYDSFAMASLGHYVSHEVLLCFVLNATFVSIRSPAFDVLVDKFIRLYPWDFGYAYWDDVVNKPELYVMGMDNGRLPPDKQKLLEAWYAAPSEIKQTRLRDVYPYNFVNDRQLEQQVGGLPLKELIENEARSSLRRLKASSLYEWTIADEAYLGELRRRLLGSGVIIDG